MQIIITKDYKELSEKAAELVVKEIKQKPNIVLGLATGSTPLGFYKKLVSAFKKKEIDFSRVVTFNLDEYYGLDFGHPQSYNSFMWDNLFSKVNVKKENVYIPFSKAKNVKNYCKWYEKAIKKAGGIDLQILGIGRDGHIGFNEPGSSLKSRTRLVKLAKETIEDNSRFFKNKKALPKYAITIGIGTIMEAKKIILLASGENKAKIVAKAVEGKISGKCPASVLQSHPNVIFITDKKAAKELKNMKTPKIEISKIKIKKATQKEIPSVASVAFACFGGMKDFKLAEDWIKSNFLAFPRMQYFVAKDKKSTLGFILWMEKGGFRKRAVIELEQVAVLPDYWDKGIGTKLIKESLKEIKKYLKKRKSNLKLIEITTGTTNKAQRLYKKVLGAKVEATVKDLFRGDEVIMFSRFKK